MKATTHSRNLTADDYRNLRAYYARLALTEAQGEVQANMSPAADRVTALAREMLEAEGVLEDPAHVALVLQNADESGPTYAKQMVADRALNALTADVTAAAMAAV